ncbi:hypothetical protein [Paenibacillus sp. UNC499MF]|uniref:hypothetical protein n=1 Tax=Paenibacillus sp. UNC499MF TaxID=1502751 RepID=UPI0008A08E94|nr:hypothetical protein [Paenibacillus sp. UNC499MF]SEG78800.1 hypothetical protein SAMN02799616_05141 [Paenibacillus sp. UNC499MF]
MIHFSFKTNEESYALCYEIVEFMMREFTIDENEAVCRINLQWSDMDFLDEDDIRYHEAPDDWAYIIYYGHDSRWWSRKNDPTLKPKPIHENANKEPIKWTFVPRGQESFILKKAQIDILLDPYSTEAEKDDAAIDLGEHFEDEETIDVLLRVSNQDGIGEMVAASCGESLAYIWLRKTEINYDQLLLLKGAALHEALSLIKAHRSDWFAEYERRLSIEKEIENSDF